MKKASFEPVLLPPRPPFYLPKNHAAAYISALIIAPLNSNRQEIAPYPPPL